MTCINPTHLQVHHSGLHPLCAAQQDTQPTNQQVRDYTQPITQTLTASPLEVRITCLHVLHS